MCEPDRRLLEEAPGPDEPAMALGATEITPGTSVQPGKPAPPPEPTEAEVEADTEAGRTWIGILVVAVGLPLWALLVRCALQKRTSAPRGSDLADSGAKSRRNSGVYIDVHSDTEKRERSSLYVPL